jgi:hypothetical protein
VDGRATAGRAHADPEYTVHIAGQPEPPRYFWRARMKERMGRKPILGVRLREAMGAATAAKGLSVNSSCTHVYF